MITYMPIRHEGTDAACGEVAFYLRGIPMGRPLSAQDAYTFDQDVPVQMVPEGETVNCLSCGKRVGLVTIERLLRHVPANPETGENVAPDDEPAPVALVIGQSPSESEPGHDDF
jgi:hypothetical protein